MSSVVGHLRAYMRLSESTNLDFGVFLRTRPQQQRLNF